MKKFGTRLLAAILVVGGLLGAAIVLLSVVGLMQVHWLLASTMAGFALLFAYATYMGVRLWRCKPGSHKRALLLYLTQIPVLTVPGFSYEWFTALSYKIQGGQVEKPTLFEIGSSFNFYFDARITEVVYGINLVAVAATAFLWLTRKAPLLEKP